MPRTWASPTVSTARAVPAADVQEFELAGCRLRGLEAHLERAVSRVRARAREASHGGLIRILDARNGPGHTQPDGRWRTTERMECLADT